MLSATPSTAVPSKANFFHSPSAGIPQIPADFPRPWTSPSISRPIP